MDRRTLHDGEDHAMHSVTLVKTHAWVFQSVKASGYRCDQELTTWRLSTKTVVYVDRHSASVSCLSHFQYVEYSCTM